MIHDSPTKIDVIYGLELEINPRRTILEQMVVLTWSEVEEME